MYNANMIPPNNAENIQTGPWGNQFPVAEEQMIGMCNPSIRDCNAKGNGSVSDRGAIIPPDPLMMRDAFAIEQSIMSNSSMIPETLTETIYTPGFLCSQLGKHMKVDFLIYDSIVCKSGELVGVGTSYILLRSPQTGDVTMCDLFTIKFVKIFNGTMC